MATAVRDPDELCDLLGLSSEFRVAARRAARSFPLVAPRGFVARMRFGDPNDPLLRQVIPLADEEAEVAGYRADPVGDLRSQRAPGLLYKYSGRALLVATGVCAIHCRYCFRRHFPYGESPKGIEQWEPAFEELARDASVEEVLLSGGDPLTLTDDRLGQLAQRLAEIPHIRRLRIHTRLPIVLPERVDERLLDWLTKSRLTPIVVVHANHPREVSGDVADALGRLVDSGVPVLNQAVLLRAINDDADTLAELCRRLVDLRVMPYYLHQLDPVAGAAHFAVPEATGVALIDELRRRLPGYAVPRYVREDEGADHKIALG